MVLNTWLIISLYVLYFGGCDLLFSAILLARTQYKLVYTVYVILHFLLKHSRDSVILELPLCQLKLFIHALEHIYNQKLFGKESSFYEKNFFFYARIFLVHFSLKV